MIYKLNYNCISKVLNKRPVRAGCERMLQIFISIYKINVMITGLTQICALFVYAKAQTQSILPTCLIQREVYIESSSQFQTANNTVVHRHLYFVSQLCSETFQMAIWTYFLDGIFNCTYRA